MREINYSADTEMLRGFPEIKKLGAINRSGEMTPFVWKGRLMRMELMDPTRGVGFLVEGKRPPIRACVRDVEKNEILSYTGEGCYFYAAYTEGDTVYITGVVMEHRDTIRIFKSEDLVNWESWDLFTRPGWTYYNTGLTKVLTAMCF